MGFILLAIFALMVLLEASRMKQVEGPKPAVVVPRCPPHEWQWVEIYDEEGNVLKSKIVCDLCGPLKPINEQ
jgi:hypothetical protein